MHPHVQAILLALAATGAAGSILLLLLVAGVRRRARGRAIPRTWFAAGALAGVIAACGAYLSLVFVGMTFNGGSYARTAVEVDGVLRTIERRDMWGRSGMCLGWDASGELDLDATGYYSGGRKEAALAFEADGVGFRGHDGKCGPWLFLGPDGEPDPLRSGWYMDDELAPWGPRGSFRPLIQQEVDDLLLAWSSR